VGILCIVRLGIDQNVGLSADQDDSENQRCFGKFLEYNNDIEKAHRLSAFQGNSEGQWRFGL
jgi:hypothetical protein